MASSSTAATGSWLNNYDKCFSSYYAEAFALLLLPKSSEAQARQTKEGNTCLRYCANFAECPECDLRLYGVLRSSQLALCIAPAQHV